MKRINKQTFSGKNSPAGRLPVTFYTGVDQLPPLDSYAMEGRTYRYFEGTPLYPFGTASATQLFPTAMLSCPADPVAAGQPVTAEVTITNSGKIAGDEVAQLYLSFPKVTGAPTRALRAFQRVHLESGQLQTVRFQLRPRDLSMVTEAGDPVMPEGTYSISVGGGQPQHRRSHSRKNFRGERNRHFTVDL
jgi:beta-glucosidase